LDKGWKARVGQFHVRGLDKKMKMAYYLKNKNDIIIYKEGDKISQTAKRICLPLMTGLIVNLLLIVLLNDAPSETLNKDFMPGIIIVLSTVGLISLAMSAFIATENKFIEHCVDAIIGGLESFFSIVILWLMQDNYKSLSYMENFMYLIFFFAIVGGIIVLKALSYNHKGAKNEA
jgi:hypothetical protein